VRGGDREGLSLSRQTFVPLAVALRSMLADTGAKLAIAAPAEKARLQERAEVLREWITPKSTTPVSI
jgi:hypothetical protein